MTPDSTNPRERWLSWLGTLGDLARLRTLRLLEREELGVGELARVATAAEHGESPPEAAL